VKNIGSNNEMSSRHAIDNLNSQGEKIQSSRQAIDNSTHTSDNASPGKPVAAIMKFILSTPKTLQL